VRGKNVLRGAAIAIVAACSLGTAQQSSPAGVISSLSEARQMILVVTASWDAVDGTLQRFERATIGAQWTAVGSPIPAVVGRSGLAWGRGVAATPADGGPIKREGDGKGPAGAYRLGRAFGQSKTPLPGLRVPYLDLADDVECVDDVKSAQYNRIVTKQQVKAVDWNSSEKMWSERLYKWGLIVEHNTPSIAAGAGSCIFLHTWNGPGRGTAGCTAMAESDLVAALTWLDPSKAPLVVQLPRAAYDALRRTWQLPAGAAGQR
jgi:zinc D-Ala-D-Ala dipeptidase